MEKPLSPRPHTLCIGTKITITGVQNVITLTDKEVSVALADNVLILGGSGFCPLHLSVDEGNLTLSGSVAEVRYAHRIGKESIWKRLFK